MGLFDLIFKNRPKPVGAYEGTFKLLNGYRPAFTTRNGGMYEQEMIRSSIHALAIHTSKLKIEVTGSAKPALRSKLEKGPNSFQTWSQFMYRLRTIYEIHNTAFICPVFDEYGEVSGWVTPLPDRVEPVQFNGVPYLRYKFSHGQTAVVEMASCGIMVNRQYRSDIFGESNDALIPTMDLIHIQDQGIKEGVKSAATYRFMAQMANFSNAEDLKNERKRFTAKNFSEDAEGGGLLLFPNTYSNIKQIDVKPWVVDADQLKIINANIFDYFGTNEDILQNKAYGDKYVSFYEGAIEPFAIQFSEVATKMTYTLREQSQGNAITATANRLQFASTQEKLNVSTQLADRGILNRDDVREIWNMPPLPDGQGQAYIIRGEYYNAEEKITEGNDGTTTKED